MPTEAPPRRPTTSFWKRRGSPRGGGALPIAGLRPFFWAAAYVLATTFAYSPTLSFRSPPAETGAIAPRDVVAPRDLIVPDSVATERRRAEAIADVLPVYDWDSAAAGRIEKKLRQSFQAAREAWAVTRHRPGSSSVPQPVRDAFELPIRDEALAALARSSFSSAIEDRLVTLADIDCPLRLNGAADCLRGRRGGGRRAFSRRPCGVRCAGRRTSGRSVARGRRWPSSTPP